MTELKFPNAGSWWTSGFGFFEAAQMRFCQQRNVFWRLASQTIKWLCYQIPQFECVHVPLQRSDSANAIMDKEAQNKPPPTPPPPPLVGAQAKQNVFCISSDVCWQQSVLCISPDNCRQQMSFALVLTFAHNSQSFALALTFADNRYLYH